MFESIAFGRDSLADIASLGELSRVPRDYKQVHAIVDHGSFTRLARVCVTLKPYLVWLRTGTSR